MSAEELAAELAVMYGLTYRASVNLEGTINNMLSYGLTIEQCDDVISDILDWADDECG
jgi:hypothetical protein